MRVAAACLVFGAASLLGAQTVASARAGATTRADSLAPPISPGKAFLYSLAVPGLAQAKLDRPIVGAGFFLVEVLSIAIIHRTTDDLRLARAYQRDSVPAKYVTDPSTGQPTLDANGRPVVATWEAGYYSSALVHARRLQVEDWSAILVFNHLIAGAEAFVAAQLWDLPGHVKFRVAPGPNGGLAFGATLTTR